MGTTKKDKEKSKPGVPEQDMAAVSPSNQAGWDTIAIIREVSAGVIAAMEGQLDKLNASVIDVDAKLSEFAKLFTDIEVGMRETTVKVQMLDQRSRSTSMLSSEGKSALDTGEFLSPVLGDLVDLVKSRRQDVRVVITSGMFLWTSLNLSPSMNYSHSTNLSNITVTNAVQLFQMIIYIPVFFFGIIFNSLAFWVFCCKLQGWTEARIYMTNLIVADCCLLFTFPFRFYSYRYEWALKEEFCIALMFIYFVNMYMSILTITTISVDRYLAIRYPLKSKYLRSPMKAAILCGLLWIFMIAFCLYGALTARMEKITFCFQKTSVDPMKPFVILTVVGFFIPLIILIFCSLNVIRSLMKKECTSLHETKSIKKIIQVISINLAVFIICFFPVHIGYLLKFAVESVSTSFSVVQNVHIFLHLAICLSDSNCCLDIFCYYFLSKEVWEASFLKFKSKANQSVKMPDMK
ncbi:G-protein coupled receptor 35-like [Rhinatrema bivittatum]|uniref:G-protein coupled receptor 35-like n=1 Tax=Rhinatrema bivittatum TaxID=194408 RepID=UPI0011287552|nr:G-protein coupled receptor 35-like [Rhinatrema bivittatum]